KQEWLSRKLCQPVWDMVLEEAYLKGELGSISFYEKIRWWTGATWIAPGWEWVDPLKEAKAAEVGLKNGIVTHSDLYSAQGKDWEESFEQRKRELDKMNELGLPQNTDTAKEKEEPEDDEEEKENKED
ncbi:MAG: phage portal protein, partial [Candidatus Micrarchaeota archaeon]